MHTATDLYFEDVHVKKNYFYATSSTEWNWNQAQPINVYVCDGELIEDFYAILFATPICCRKMMHFTIWLSLLSNTAGFSLTWPLYGKRLHLSESFLKFGWIILHRSVGSARRHPTAQRVMIQSLYSAQSLINQLPERFTEIHLKWQNKPQPWFWQKKTLGLIKRLTGMPIMVCDFPDPVWP